MKASAAEDQRWWRATWLAFALGWLTTLVVMPGVVAPVSDGVARMQEAHWAWSGETTGGVLAGRNGILHEHFGAGQTLLMVPVDWLLSKCLPGLAGPNRGSAADPRILRRFLLLAYSLFPIINGLALAVALPVLRRLGFALREAVAGILGLQFLSTALWHVQNNQENPMILGLALGGSLGILTWIDTRSPKPLVWAGLLLGWLILIRIPNLAIVVSVGLIPFWVAWRGRDVPLARQYFRAALLYLSPGLLLGIALDRGWQFWRFGDWRTTYMDGFRQWVVSQYPDAAPGFPFQAPFLDGFLGALFSPGKSAFIYDPLLVLFTVVALICWRRMNFRQQAAALAAVGCMVLTWAGYARFFVWSGEAAWGNRYGATAVHLGVLLALPLWLRHGPPNLRGPVTILRRATLVLIFLLQIVSLVYPAWVEMTQAGYSPTDFAQVTSANPEILGRHADTFRLGQRVMNIAGQVTGHYSDWGLDRARGGKTVGLHPVILLPFQPLTTLSPPLRIGARLIWWAAATGLAALIWTLWVFSRETGRPSHAREEPLDAT